MLDRKQLHRRSNLLGRDAAFSLSFSSANLLNFSTFIRTKLRFDPRELVALRTVIGNIRRSDGSRPTNRGYFNPLENLVSHPFLFQSDLIAAANCLYYCRKLFNDASVGLWPDAVIRGIGNGNCDRTFSNGSDI